MMLMSFNCSYRNKTSLRPYTRPSGTPLGHQEGSRHHLLRLVRLLAVRNSNETSFNEMVLGGNLGTVGLLLTKSRETEIHKNRTVVTFDIGEVLPLRMHPGSGELEMVHHVKGTIS